MVPPSNPYPYPTRVTEQRHVYVYYRVPRQQVECCRMQASKLQARVAHWARACRLMHRPEWRDETQTWMEVYEGVAEVDALLKQISNTLELDDFALLRSLARHSEIFVEYPGVS